MGTHVLLRTLQIHLHGSQKSYLLFVTGRTLKAAVRRYRFAYPELDRSEAILFSNKVDIQYNTKSIAELIHLYKTGALELSPTFQRRSVWTNRDRRNLIDSIARNYPLPAVFLYRPSHSEQVKYSVIDGKQRLETILAFLGAIPRMAVEVTLELPGTDAKCKVDAHALRTKKELRDLFQHFQAYKVSIVEVAGDLSQIVELFVRINSTGKVLSPQERRKAQYSGSPLLLQATKLADQYAEYFKSIRTFSEQQLQRMKLVEFMAELIVSSLQGGPVHKKTAVDHVMSSEFVSAAELMKAVSRVSSAVDLIRRHASGIEATRFKHVADLYSLLLLIDKLTREGAVLDDTECWRQAWGMLRAFASQVDRSNEAGRQRRELSLDEHDYQAYLSTVAQGTDAVEQRQKRQQILLNVVSNSFVRRDRNRSFTPLQRRILWNSSKDRKCTYPNCKTLLNWNTFTIDHMLAHSKGGSTSIENAALMCRAHNSSKGARALSR